jgi:hypothetical protein
MGHNTRIPCGIVLHLLSLLPLGTVLEQSSALPCFVPCVQLRQVRRIATLISRALPSAKLLALGLTNVDFSSLRTKRAPYLAAPFSPIKHNIRPRCGRL